MARLKIPDVTNSENKSDDTTGDINKADFSKDSICEELTNANPVVLTPEQYSELFGDSEDDNVKNIFQAS